MLWAAAVPDAWPSPSISAVPDAGDTAAESGGERVEDEREEESESKSQLFFGRSSTETATDECRCLIGPGACRLPPPPRPSVVPIRGPPGA